MLLAGLQNIAPLPPSVQQLFKYVANLGFQDMPNYDKCRAFFRDELRQTGGRVDLAPAKPNGTAASRLSPMKSAAAAVKSPVKKVAKKSVDAAAVNGGRRAGAASASPSPARAVRRGRPAAVISDSFR